MTKLWCVVEVSQCRTLTFKKWGLERWVGFGILGLPASRLRDTRVRHVGAWTLCAFRLYLLGAFNLFRKRVLLCTYLMLDEKLKRRCFRGMMCMKDSYSYDDIRAKQVKCRCFNGLKRKIIGSTFQVLDLQLLARQRNGASVKSISFFQNLPPRALSPIIYSISLSPTPPSLHNHLHSISPTTTHSFVVVF